MVVVIAVHRLVARTDWSHSVKCACRSSWLLVYASHNVGCVFSDPPDLDVCYCQIGCRPVSHKSTLSLPFALGTRVDEEKEPLLRTAVSSSALGTLMQPHSH